MDTGIQFAAKNTQPRCSGWGDAMTDTALKTPQRIELSIVMPCLNEAETLGHCIAQARAFLSQNRVAGEIIVADNGSSDGSQAIARAQGARVVDIAERGYGSALLGGIAAA